MTDFFSRSLEIAWAAGIAHDRIVLDPGIGFGKTSEQSLACIARLHEWRGFDLPLLVGASRKRFINSIVPSEPMRAAGRVARRASDCRRKRRRHYPRPRCRADGAGARGCRRHQARAMTDTIFVNGLALHAYHGVMQHEAKVGQTFRLDLALDIDLAAASRSDKLKDTVSYDTVVKRRARRFVRAATSWSKPLPARSPTRCWNAALWCAAFASPCTSRTRRSRRHSTTSALPSSARAAANMAETSAAGISRARRQYRRRARDLRSGDRDAVRRRRGAADGAFVGLPHPALGRDRSAAFHQCGHRGCDHAAAARSAGTRARGRAGARP